MDNDLFVAATWVPHVRCPRCLSKRVKTTRTLPILPGNTARVRYHRCLSKKCRALFKSVEVLSLEGRM